MSDSPNSIFLSYASQDAAAAARIGEDLRAACLAALDIPREAARARAQSFSWDESARQFLGHIEERRAALLNRTA